MTKNQMMDKMLDELFMINKEIASLNSYLPVSKQLDLSASQHTVVLMSNKLADGSLTEEEIMSEITSANLMYAQVA